MVLAAINRPLFPTGCERYNDAHLQMPRDVWELQYKNLLDTAVRLQGSRQLLKDQIQSRWKTRHRPKAHECRKQRGQPRCHHGRARQHRPVRAHLPAGLSGLLQEEYQLRRARHRGPRVSPAWTRFNTRGEKELPQTVSWVRPESGREAHGGGEQLQLQIPLVLQGALRGMFSCYSRTRVRQEGRWGRPETARSWTQMKNHCVDGFVCLHFSPLYPCSMVSIY